MNAFPRLSLIVCAIFSVHPSVVRETVTLAALSSSHRDTAKRWMLSEAIDSAFGVFVPERDLTDCLTLGALAEAIDDELARARLTGEAPSPSYVSDFLASADGLALTRSFTRITSPKLRRRVVDLVEQIASEAA